VCLFVPDFLALQSSDEGPSSLGSSVSSVSPSGDADGSPQDEKQQLDIACAALLTAVATGPKEAVAATKARKGIACCCCCSDHSLAVQTVQGATMARLRSAKQRLETAEGASKKALEQAVGEMAAVLKDLVRLSPLRVTSRTYHGLPLGLQVAAIRAFARNEVSAESVGELVAKLQAVDLEGTADNKLSPRRPVSGADKVCVC
jgi:hypothetical protein